MIFSPPMPQAFQTTEAPTIPQSNGMQFSPAQRWLVNELAMVRQDFQMERLRSQRVEASLRLEIEALRNRLTILETVPVAPVEVVPEIVQVEFDLNACIREIEARGNVAVDLG